MKNDITITRMNKSSWFKLEWNDIIIHVDPGYAGMYENQGIKEDELKVKADLILVTHNHKDHLRVDVIERLSKEGTIIIAPPICIQDLHIPFNPIRPKQKFEHQLFHVLAVDAYNTPTGRSIRKFHQKGDFVGYILTLGHNRLYFAGDTDVIEEMNDWSTIDIAFLPIGGTYVMDADEAVDAVGILKPKIVIPMHQAEADLNQFQLSISNKYGIETIIMNNGDKYIVAS
jgi:L-ascorbate metabolism protein UlaG (beta-lactamase superfamily)